MVGADAIQTRHAVGGANASRRVFNAQPFESVRAIVRENKSKLKLFTHDKCCFNEN